MAWIVQTRGTRKADMEVSAVDENSHGAKSWGWGDVSSKIIINLQKPSPEILKITQDCCRVICNYMNKLNKV